MYCVLSLSSRIPAYEDLFEFATNESPITTTVYLILIIAPLIGTILFYNKRTIGWIIMTAFLVYLILEHFALGNIYISHDTYSDAFSNFKGIHKHYYENGSPELIGIMSFFILANIYMMFIRSIRDMFDPSNKQIGMAIVYGVIFFASLYFSQ